MTTSADTARLIATLDAFGDNPFAQEWVRMIARFGPEVRPDYAHWCVRTLGGNMVELEDLTAVYDYDVSFRAGQLIDAIQR